MVQFSVTVTDEDMILAPPTIVAENLPDSNASFNFTSGSASGQFTFTPDFTQSGTYHIRFIGIDDRAAADTQVVQIDILEAGNQPPSFGASVPDTMLVPTGYEYEIILAPYDPEADSITVEVYPILPGATWANNGDGTWSYSFTADIADVGTVFEITFVVTDYPGQATDTLVTHPIVVAFLRGDMDSNNLYTANDLTFFIDFLFRNGPGPAIPEVADTDGSGSVSIGDLVYLIYYMFRNGPPPAP